MNNKWEERVKTGEGGDIVGVRARRDVFHGLTVNENAIFY